MRRVHDGRAGQGLVEYGLMTALTSALTLLWLVVFGGTLSDALTAIGRGDRSGRRRLTGRPRSLVVLPPYHRLR